MMAGMAMALAGTMATTLAGMAMAMAAMALMALMALVLPGVIGALAARAALRAALLQLAARAKMLQILFGTLKCYFAYTFHHYMGVKNAGSIFESDVQASFIMVVSTGYLFI